MRLRATLLGGLALLALGAGPAWASWTDDQLKQITLEAETGDGQRQYEVGVALLERGDRAGGLGWIRRAAEHGRVEAQVDLARRYERGDGLPQDAALALKWYELAAHGGDPTALGHLAAFAEAGTLGQAARQLAPRLWQYAADRGHPDAALHVGRGLLKSPSQRADAMQYLEIAADGGLAPARLLLADQLARPDARPEDLARAYFQLGCAEEEGVATADRLSALEPRLAKPALVKAQLKLADWCAQHEGKAAGQATYGPDGKPVYKSGALKWRRQAAANGDVSLKLELAEMLAQGTTLPKLPDEAERLFGSACAGGDRVALRKFGKFLLDQGQPRRAVPTLERAAQAGDAEAMSTLMYGYKQGDQGIPRDVMGCVRWLKVLATVPEKRPTAAADLADCYARGWGLPQDLDQARKWLQVAAEEGHPTSALKWAKGLEQAKDLVGAATWYDLAARNHHPCGKVYLERLAKAMPPDQLAKARQEAEAWWAAHPKAHGNWAIATGCD